VLTVSGLSKSHGARTLFRDVTFRLSPGRRIALIGANGVGKTTILEIVMGLQDLSELKARGSFFVAGLRGL
jgi:ATP-binding cassette subfamily F protein 3